MKESTLAIIGEGDTDEAFFKAFTDRLEIHPVDTYPKRRRRWKK